MSFLVGPISGALVAGGVYYGFSNLINSRTDELRKDLRVLSVRMVEAPTLVPAPPSAAVRIDHRPFASMLKSKWNEQLEGLFEGASRLEGQAAEWGSRYIYGRHSSVKE